MKLIRLDTDVQPIIDKGTELGFRCRGVHIDGENRRRALTLIFELPSDSDPRDVAIKEAMGVPRSE